MTTTYQGTQIGRRVLFVRGGYYLLADDAQPYTYTWQLHGYGLAGGNAATGTFADGLAAHESTWQKNGVSLLAHVTATGGAATYRTATNAPKPLTTPPKTAPLCWCSRWRWRARSFWPP